MPINSKSHLIRSPDQDSAFCFRSFHSSSGFLFLSSQREWWRWCWRGAPAYWLTLSGSRTALLSKHDLGGGEVTSGRRHASNRLSSVALPLLWQPPSTLTPGHPRWPSGGEALTSGPSRLLSLSDGDGRLTLVSSSLSPAKHLGMEGEVAESKNTSVQRKRMVSDPSRGGTGALGAGWHQGLSQALLLFLMNVSVCLSWTSAKASSCRSGASSDAFSS